LDDFHYGGFDLQPVKLNGEIWNGAKTSLTFQNGLRTAQLMRGHKSCWKIF